MKIHVGSTNPTKVQAVQLAVEACSQLLAQGEVYGISVPSGVAAQPLSDAETKQGALQRARAVLHAQDGADLGIGLEGGVEEREDGMYSVVWVAVVDSIGRETCASGARFRIADRLAERIRQGQEMGPAMDELTNMNDIRSNQGMIGVVTGGVLTRADEYGHIATMALALHLTNWN